MSYIVRTANGNRYGIAIHHGTLLFGIDDKGGSARAMLHQYAVEPWEARSFAMHLLGASYRAEGHPSAANGSVTDFLVGRMIEAGVRAEDAKIALGALLSLDEHGEFINNREVSR